MKRETGFRLLTTGCPNLLFDQVMAKQSVAREPASKNPLQRIHFIDPFTDKNTFTVEILKHIRSCVRIDVEPVLSE